MAYTHETEIKLGSKYRDKQTGIEGHAALITFHQYACEQIGLVFQREGKKVYEHFDADALELVEELPEVPTRSTGGPDREFGSVPTAPTR